MTPYELGTAIQECLAHAGPSRHHDTDVVRFSHENGSLTVLGTDTQRMFRRAFPTDVGHGIREFSVCRADAECLLPSLLGGRSVEVHEFASANVVHIVTSLGAHRQEVSCPTDAGQRFPAWRTALNDFGYVGIGNTTCQQMLDFVRTGTVRIGASNGTVRINGSAGAWFDARLVRAACCSIGLTSAGDLTVQQLGPHNGTGKPGPLRMFNAQAEAWVAALDRCDELSREAA